MPEEQPETPETEQPQPISGPQTLYIYSNYTSITAAPEEFIMRFCIRDAENPAKAAEVARVFLSLGHAKRLVLAMARSIKSYEEIFGEISLDPIQHVTEEGRIKLGIKPSDEKAK